MGLPAVTNGNGNGKYQLLKAFVERAPELAAICIIVAMFLWHLGQVSRQGIEALGKVEAAMEGVRNTLFETTKALLVLNEQTISLQRERQKEHDDMEKDRAHEHDEILKRLERR